MKIAPSSKSKLDTIEVESHFSAARPPGSAPLNNLTRDPPMTKFVKNKFSVHIEKNALTDEGDGIIRFPNGQVITDATTQRNGTKYDIESMELQEYNGHVTGEHKDELFKYVGEAFGLAKRAGSVVIDGIRFAHKQSAYAKLAYDLISNGFPLDLSIETYGPWPDESDDTYYKAKLMGLSVVVVGNNKSATMAQVARNSLEEARQEGLDTTEAEKVLPEVEEPKEPETPPEPPIEEPKPAETPEAKPKAVTANNSNTNQEPQDMKFVTIKNARDFAVKLKYKNAAGDETEAELAPDATVDVSEEQKEAVEAQLNSAQAPQPDVNELVNNAVSTAVKPLQDELAQYKEAFNKGAKEPEFTKAGDHQPRQLNRGPSSSKLADMEWKERTGLQLQSIYGSLRGDRNAAETAHAINQFHLEELQEAGIVSNAVDLPDLGNFVIPRQMVTEIKEQASNYRPLLDVFRFEETMSLETAWLKGTGEIDMEDVDMDDNGDNEDLKPIKTPTFSTDTTRLYEFAAVTPVKASAIRFAAADLVQHITRLYRRAYDRRLAQSVIGRLEKAVEGNGNSVIYDYSSAAGGDVEALITLVTAWGEIAEHSPNAYFIMTEASRLQLVAMAMRAGTNGPLANLFTQSPDGVRFLSKPYIIVPSDLMPNLNTATTKTWGFEDVASVTVNHGVLLADPADFVGKVSGGLNFQVSDVASYEEGETVKSAYQRDELVFRGYGFRASGLYFEENVSGILSPGVS